MSRRKIRGRNRHPRLTGPTFWIVPSPDLAGDTAARTGRPLHEIDQTNARLAELGLIRPVAGGATYAVAHSGPFPDGLELAGREIVVVGALDETPLFRVVAREGE